MFKNSVLSLLTSIFGRVITLVLTVFFAQNLEKQLFGFLMLVRNTCGMLDQVLSSSVGNVVLTDIAKNKGEVTHAHIQISIVLNLVVCIGLVSISLIQVWIFPVFGMVEWLNFISFESFLLINILLFFSLFSSHLQKIYIGKGAYITSLKASIIGFFLCVILISLAVFCFDVDLILGIASFACYFLIDSSVRLVLLRLNLFKLLIQIFNFKFLKLLFLKILAMGSLAIAALASAVFFWVVKVSIGKTTEGLLLLADFEVSYLLVGLTLVITGVVVNVSTQAIASGVNKNELNVLYKAILLNIMVVVAMAIFFYFTAPLFYKLLGESFILSDEVFWAMIGYLATMVIYSFTNRLLIIKSEHSYLLNITLTSMFISILALVFIDIRSAEDLYYAFSFFLLIISLGNTFKYVKVISK